MAAGVGRGHDNQWNSVHKNDMISTGISTCKDELESYSEELLMLLKQPTDLRGCPREIYIRDSVVV